MAQSNSNKVSEIWFRILFLFLHLLSLDTEIYSFIFFFLTFRFYWQRTKECNEFFNSESISRINNDHNISSDIRPSWHIICRRRCSRCHCKRSKTFIPSFENRSSFSFKAELRLHNQREQNRVARQLRHKELERNAPDVNFFIYPN